MTHLINLEALIFTCSPSQIFLEDLIQYRIKYVSRKIPEWNTYLAQLQHQLQLQLPHLYNVHEGKQKKKKIEKSKNTKRGKKKAETLTLTRTNFKNEKNVAQKRSIKKSDK